MNKKFMAFTLSVLLGDLLYSFTSNIAIDKRTPQLAQMLVNDGIDFDFLLILAGANPENLKEATDLAFEELKHILKGGIGYVLNHNELPTAE